MRNGVAMHLLIDNPEFTIIFYTSIIASDEHNFTHPLSKMNCVLSTHSSECTYEYTVRGVYSFEYTLLAVYSFEYTLLAVY